jgi:hypothetical protein
VARPVSLKVGTGDFTFAAGNRRIAISFVGGTLVLARSFRSRRPRIDPSDCLLCHAPHRRRFLNALSDLHQVQKGTDEVAYEDGKVAAVGGEKDVFLTINGNRFSRLAIFSKPVAGVNQAFYALMRWRRRGRVIAKGYARREVGSGVMRRQELDAFIRFALETLPQRTASTEEARAVLIAEGIITVGGDLAAEYRPAGDSGKLVFLRPRTLWAGSAT